MLNAPQQAEEVRRHLRRLQELPPPPQSAQRLLRCVQDEDVEFDELTRLIEACPAVAARIVGLSNSAYFGQGARVRSVREAIVRVLGLALVRDLVVGMAVSGAFEAGRCRGFSALQYWGSALVTATLTRQLSRRVRHTEDAANPDGSYLAGLLHNLGMLALAHVAPREMERVLESVAHEPERSLREVERGVLGVDHCQAGAWLVRRWHLPEEVGVVIEHRHCPEYRGPHWPLCLLVGLASRWARQRLAGVERPLLELASAETLGLDEKSVAAAARECEDQFHDIQDLAALFAARS